MKYDCILVTEEGWDWSLAESEAEFEFELLHNWIQLKGASHAW